MKAMVIKKISRINEGSTPLELLDITRPQPGYGEILIKVSTCGICHTELDEIEGRTPPSSFPMVPGHQIVGTVHKLGDNTSLFNIGDRVGVAWIYSACGNCSLCKSGDENLCPAFQATGRDHNGGYAQFMKVNESFAYAIPNSFSDEEAAPLLCAGAIGHRSLRLTGIKDGENLGLTGFGGSAHLVLQLARHTLPKSNIFVLARKEEQRDFAMQHGAFWAGNIEEQPPELMHAIIDTTPAWQPVIQSLKNLAPGGRFVINAIRKEQKDQSFLANLDYSEHLWMEKEIKSVANVCRQDVIEFLELAAQIPIRPIVQKYTLAEANTALVELRHGKIRGSKILVID